MFQFSCRQIPVAEESPSQMQTSLRACPQASIGKSISPEEQWLRLLAIELRPQLNLMRANQLSPGNALLHWRTHLQSFKVQ